MITHTMDEDTTLSSWDTTVLLVISYTIYCLNSTNMQTDRHTDVRTMRQEMKIYIHATANDENVHGDCFD